MSKIENFVGFVKEQVDVQNKLAKKYDDSPYRRSQHLKSAKGFSDLSTFLEEIQMKGTDDISYLHRADTPQKRISLVFEEIADAPDELLKELNLSETDRQDLYIEYLIAKSGGVLSLDKIIVAIYKHTGEIPKRNTVISRLYRMAGRGLIFNVPGKKGVYSTYELSPQDVRSMFGQADAEPEDASGQPQQPAQTQPSAPAPESRSADPRSAGSKLRSALLAGASAASQRM